MHAILPAAGRGTRMASVTGGLPKEALPLGDSTVLQHVCDECIASHAALKLVWSDSKGKIPVSPFCLDLSYDQPEPLGLGDAVRRALGAGEEPVLVALPDVVFPFGGPLPWLISALHAGADFAIAVEEVSPERTHLYGIAEIAGDEDWRIERLIEKPPAGETQSRWAVASRYALGLRTVERLIEWPSQGEFGLTEVLQAVLDDGGIGLAFPLKAGQLRYDCGSPEGYASARMALG